MADVIRSYDGQYLNHEEIEFIANIISKHMGQFNTDKKTGTTLPKPDDSYSELVHLADYLASRKSLTMEFENYAMPSTKIEFDPDYKLKFGKYTGQRLIDVNRFAPDYVEWMEANITRQDVIDMIKAMKKYLEEQEGDL